MRLSDRGTRSAGQRSHPEQGSGRTNTSSDALDVHAVHGAQEVAQQDLAASRSGPRRRKAVYHQPIPTRTSARLASIEDYPDADRLGRVCAADVSASFFRGIPCGCGTAAACTHDHAAGIPAGAGRRQHALTSMPCSRTEPDPPGNGVRSLRWPALRFWLNPRLMLGTFSRAGCRTFRQSHPRPSHDIPRGAHAVQDRLMP